MTILCIIVSLVILLALYKELNNSKFRVKQEQLITVYLDARSELDKVNLSSLTQFELTEFFRQYDKVQNDIEYHMMRYEKNTRNDKFM